ncbi:MAG: response regulator [Chitinophagia bacterium]
MALATVMWVDDEIELLEAHRLFLEKKGYLIRTFTNGHDAIAHLQHEAIDLVLLDESMPGISGLETLSKIKHLQPLLPIVLVTKNETESLMEEAIGSQIADYLIKPVNPNQVLLTLKKLLDNKRLVSEKTISGYHQAFRTMFDEIEEKPDHQSWAEMYKRLTYWEIEMGKSDSEEMMEVLLAQKKEANAAFFKYISRHYAAWVKGIDDAPLMSHQLFRKKVLPYLGQGVPAVWIVVDNLRYDHWKAFEPLLAEYFRIQEEDSFYSILPTATHYCRNAIFAGDLPDTIQKRFPEKWRKDIDEEGKNNEEEFFLKDQLIRTGLRDLSFSYQKISALDDAQLFQENALGLLKHDLSVVVYNFVDMISHARSEMDMIKELAGDEIAYRSLVKSWFMHSPLYQALKKLSEKKCMIIFTTDHGSIRVKDPVRVVADKQTTSNLRYKNGKNLDYDPRQVFVCRDPESIGLPRQSVNSSFIFAEGQDFFCYQNNFHHYANLYKDSFQHGGISLEEMIVPVIRMVSKL